MFAFFSLGTDHANTRLSRLMMCRKKGGDGLLVLRVSCRSAAAAAADAEGLRTCDPGKTQRMFRGYYMKEARTRAKFISSRMYATIIPSSEMHPHVCRKAALIKCSGSETDIEQEQ